MTETQAQPKSAKTVTVACKLPNGIVLHVDEMVESQEPVMGGGTRTTKVARRLEQTFYVKGNAVPVDMRAKHQITDQGYALTPGVDADFFAKWMEQHKNSQMVKNKLIFSAAGRDEAEGKSVENAKARSGLEPLDPSFTVGANGRIVPADPRYPKSLNPNLTEVHQAVRE